jgi:hypothetical protein
MPSLLSFRLEKKRVEAMLFLVGVRSRVLESVRAAPSFDHGSIDSDVTMPCYVVRAFLLHEAFKVAHGSIGIEEIPTWVLLSCISVETFKRL